MATSSSGIDTTLIVQTYVARWTSQYITPLQTQVNTKESEKSSLNTISSLVNDLSSKLLTLKSGTAFMARSATSSNETALTAAADETATTGTYNIGVTTLAQSHKVASSQFAAAGTVISTAEGAGARSFRITINGASTDISVNVNAGDTDQTVLANIASAINGSGVAATANVINETGTSARLVVSSNNTGVANSMVMQDLAGGTLLRNSNVINGVGAFANQLQVPLDAQFTIDGLAMTRSSNTVSDAITGVTLQLKGNGNSTLTVGGDVQAITDTINNFITSYNALIDELHTDTAYDSTTKTSGALIGYSIARNMPYDLVNEVGFPVNGLPDAFNSLYSIGIDTDKTGKLSIVDSAKLTNALQNNLTSVTAIFNDPVDGIATRTKNYVDSLISGGALDTTISGVDSEIQSLNDWITQRQSELSIYQRQLEVQYGALDALLTNNQSLLNSVSGFTIMPKIGA